MAYPLNKHTKSKYIASAFQSYQRIEPEKFYYMPQITDELSNTWTIKVCNPSDPINPLETLSSFSILPGYRIFLSETLSQVNSYNLIVLNTSNELIFNQAFYSLDYGLAELAFINAADILPTTVPKKPTNLALTVVSHTTINLSWTDASTDESSFRIQRSLDGTSSWTTIGTVIENVTTYSDNSLSPNTTYYYRIIAYNAIGDSTASTKKSAKTLIAPPNAPSNIIVSTISATQLLVEWTEGYGTETGFIVQRSLDNSSWTIVHTTPTSNVFTFSDSGLTSGTTYYYRVSAFNGSGNSGYSLSGNGSTLQSVPTAPSNLNATASGLNIVLTWTDNSNNETGFKLERSIHNTKVWTEIATLAANATSHGDTGLEAGTSYDYRVRAYNSGGNSDYTLTATATTLAIPSKPYLLSVNVSSSTELTLSWTDGSTNESSFKIERSLNGVSSWTQIATVSANVITYSDTGLASQTKYYYRARAYNAAGNSDYSNIANGTTLQSPPATPLDFDIVVISTSSVKLTWTVVSADQTAFVIDKSTNGGLTWTSTVINTPGLETYTATGLNYNTTYSFRVFARNLGGDSEPTKTIDIRVIL